LNLEELRKKIIKEQFDSTKIRAIAIDIDGTLANHESKCSLRTEQAVKKLIETGREVYIVTGRGTKTAMSYALQCGIPKNMINYNGGTIWNFENKKKEFEKCIGMYEALNILQILNKYQVLAFIYSDDEFYYEIENELLERYLDRVTIKGIKRSLEELPLDSFQKVFIMADDEVTNEIYSELKELNNENLYTIMTTPGIHSKYDNKLIRCIEIMHKSVNKGRTLKQLLDSKGISLEETVAFGDDTNDIEMISMVGWGVAMENAIPDLKKVARFETLSNQEDGVAIFIENFLL